MDAPVDCAVGSSTRGPERVTQTSMQIGSQTQVLNFQGFRRISGVKKLAIHRKGQKTDTSRTRILFAYRLLFTEFDDIGNIFRFGPTIAMNRWEAFVDALTSTAASGLRARMESLEMLANNLANVSTDGFKLDRESYSLYLSPEALEPAGDGTISTPPVVERHWTDFTQGMLRSTGSPLDLALSGRGLFVVNGPNGRMYTRNGRFRLSASGVLSTEEGYTVSAIGGETIQTQSSSPIEVAPDGTVSQDGQMLGRLAIVDFNDAGALSKHGATYFKASDRQTPIAAPTTTEVRQGKVEGSNVTSAEAAVRLIGVMRQFEMLQRAITLGSEMNRKAVEEVAKTGS